jgi:hypothetical protein
MKENKITTNQIKQLLALSIEVGNEAIILEKDGNIIAAKDMLELSIRGMSAAIKSNPLRNKMKEFKDKMKEFKERLRSLKQFHLNNLKTITLQDEKGEFDIEFLFD